MIGSVALLAFGLFSYSGYLYWQKNITEKTISTGGVIVYPTDTFTMTFTATMTPTMTPTLVSTPEPIFLAPNEVYLSVPFYWQLPLSCEATSLAMALAYKGANPGQQTLIDQMGFDNTPIQKNGSDVIIWGDPYAAFVGNIYGTQYVDGYGIYWDPVARVGSNYRPTLAFTGWSLAQILTEVQNGNPVIVWGSISGGVDSWQTEGGREVYAVHGEHTRVVTGFVGTVNNPSLIYVNDPYFGQLALYPSSFWAFASWFGGAGVVVR